jgi:TPR repeat protein
MMGKANDDPRCMDMLGWMYMNGNGVKKDVFKAKELYL